MGHALRQLEVISAPAAAGAMLDPTRMLLLRSLAEPGSASSLAKATGESRQRINYHLRELERAGLVQLVEQRMRGNCVERIVRATATAYLVSPDALGALGPDPARIADRASSSYLIAVSAETIREVATLRDRAERAGKQLPTLTVQTEVRFDSPESMNAFAEEASAMLAALAAKHHAGAKEAADGRLFKFALTGYPAITKPESPQMNTEGHGSEPKPA